MNWIWCYFLLINLQPSQFKGITIKIMMMNLCKMIEQNEAPTPTIIWMIFNCQFNAIPHFWQCFCESRKRKTSVIGSFWGNNCNDKLRKLHIDSCYEKQHTHNSWSFAWKTEAITNSISFVFFSFLSLWLNQNAVVPCVIFFRFFFYQFWNLGVNMIFVAANFKYHWVH